MSFSFNTDLFRISFPRPLAARNHIQNYSMDLNFLLVSFDFEYSLSGELQMNSIENYLLYRAKISPSLLSFAFWRTSLPHFKVSLYLLLENMISKDRMKYI